MAVQPALSDLHSFQSDSKSAFPLIPPAQIEELTSSAPGVEADGWIADRLETLTLWRDARGILTCIPAAGLYWTSAGGDAICQVSGPAGLDPLVLSQSLLGPPLVLALALRGVWCLHASAVYSAGRAAAFLGNSGAGKSTLAAFAAGQPAARRLADDILPVTIQDGRLWALPHFPQLKLPASVQPGLDFPERVPLTAIYLLEEAPSMIIEPLSPSARALTLASHSVAARLFDRPLLSAHFDFCVQAAPMVSISRFAYPRIFSELPAVWQSLQNHLAGLHA